MQGNSPEAFEQLLGLIVCPQDKGKLELQGDYLVNPRLSIAYPIQDGIPVLLADAAVPLDSLR